MWFADTQKRYDRDEFVGRNIFHFADATVDSLKEWKRASNAVSKQLAEGTDLLGHGVLTLRAK